MDDRRCASFHKYSDVSSRQRLGAASVSPEGGYLLRRDPRLKRGVPRSGLWSEEWESPRSGVRYASGTGSERAKVASVAEGKPPRALGPPPERIGENRKVVVI